MEKVDCEAVEISVVVPAYNEQRSIGVLCSKLVEILESETNDFEIVIVDDGSTDATTEVLDAISRTDSRIRVIELSRNFGKEGALVAGLSSSTGSAVLLLDADLQHPPELIPKMISEWRRGYEVVSARKVTRGPEPIAYGMLSRLFNYVMTLAIGRSMAGSSDFKLLDRQVVDAVLACPERHRFFRGIVTWVGFRVTSIDFAVDARMAGRSKWKLRKLLGFSLANIVAFTSMPLLLVAFIGFFTVGLGILMLFHTLYTYFSGLAAIGFTTVIAVQILIGGMILFSIGVVAIYVAQIYDEIKQRPLFFVRRRSSITSSFSRAESTSSNDYSTRDL
jgi:glycosyltransferase involved in cell wall biosynthesis